MPLTYPLPAGIHIFCYTGKHLNRLIPFYKGFNTLQPFAIDQTGTGNKIPNTPSFNLNILSVVNLAILTFISKHMINPGFNELIFF